MNKTIKIGARGSKLSLYQANKVKAELEEKNPGLNVELVIIKTKGDKILDSPLSQIGDKGLFVKEIEEELISGGIDLAVHSLKDLPGVLPDELKLGAVLERAEVRDVLISDGRNLDELTENDIIGTSSVRRRAQLLRFNSSFTIRDIRGNVDTRLAKLDAGEYSAIILAGAGVTRLGLTERITEYLDPEIMIPAVSQGIIGIETRREDPFVDETVATINDAETFQVGKAERSFLRTLEGGCQAPIACYTAKNGDSFEITGYLSGLNGQDRIVKTTTCGFDELPVRYTELGKKMLESGGDEVMKEIRDNL